MDLEPRDMRNQSFGEVRAAALTAFRSAFERFVAEGGDESFSMSQVAVSHHHLSPFVAANTTQALRNREGLVYARQGVTDVEIDPWDPGQWKWFEPCEEVVAVTMPIELKHEASVDRQPDDGQDHWADVRERADDTFTSILEEVDRDGVFGRSRAAGEAAVLYVGQEFEDDELRAMFHRLDPPAIEDRLLEVWGLDQVGRIATTRLRTAPTCELLAPVPVVCEHLFGYDLGMSSLPVAADLSPNVDPFDVAVRAIDELRYEDRSTWAPQDRLERQRELAALLEQLQTTYLLAVGEIDARTDWAVNGGVSTIGHLTYTTQTTRTAAQRTVHAARLLRRFEATSAAATMGDLSPAKLEVLAAKVTPERLEHYQRHEQALLESARIVRNVDDYAKVVARWAHLADDELDDATAKATGTRPERCHLSLAADRAYLNAELNPDNYALLMAALSAVDPGKGALDGNGDQVDPVDSRRRTNAERMAENLIELARRALQAETAKQRPTAAVRVVVDWDLLTADQPPADGDNRPVVVDLVTARADIIGVGPVPLDTVRRLLCTSAVGRAVMRGRSDVLDLGRHSRLFTDSQRAAIVLRDHGCVAQGCDRGPDWCEVHHLRPWEHHGPTDLHNGVLLCTRHHHLVHEGRWHVGHDEHGRYRLWRPERPPQRRPRRLVTEPERRLSATTVGRRELHRRQRITGTDDDPDPPPTG